jgi:hypothetical protein
VPKSNCTAKKALKLALGEAGRDKRDRKQGHRALQAFIPTTTRKRTASKNNMVESKSVCVNLSNKKGILEWYAL